MKFSTGKRIGQSGQELLTAAVFSFVLHVCAAAAVALFYISSAPRAFLPPVYDVKLVGLPAALHATNVASQAAPAPAAAAPAPVPAPRPAKPAPKPKQTAAKPRKAPAPVPQNAMPELGKAKPKPEKKEPPKSAEPAPEQAAPPAAAASQQPAGPAGSGTAGSPPGAASGAKGEGVAVSASSQQEFPFSWYLAVVRDKIGQNWRPSPDAPDAKVRVIFTINRSGWVVQSDIVKEQSKATFAFEQAAMRAIRASNPFPALPDDYSKQTLEFSVDLTPND